MDLFHTPNLRYLKNILIFKVSPTLKQLFENDISKVAFWEPIAPHSRRVLFSNRHSLGLF
jgi:hypothetical protein